METLTADGIPPRIKNDHVELRMTEAGEMTVSFITLKAGADLGPALVGMDGNRCPCPHWGYMLTGSLLMRTANGDQTFRAGDAFYWAAGHVPVALEDCSYVDFSPTEEFAAVIRHIEGG
jgi:hypothetical protein